MKVVTMMYEMPLAGIFLIPLTFITFFYDSVTAIFASTFILIILLKWLMNIQESEV